MYKIVANEKHVLEFRDKNYSGKSIKIIIEAPTDCINSLIDGNKELVRNLRPKTGFQKALEGKDET